MYGSLRHWMAHHRRRTQLLRPAIRHGDCGSCGIHLASACDGVPVTPLLAPQRRSPLIPRRWWADWRCPRASRNRHPARLPRMARHHQHLCRASHLPRLPRLLGVQEHRQDRRRRRRQRAGHPDAGNKASPSQPHPVGRRIRRRHQRHGIPRTHNLLHNLHK